jgi:sugar lactone lactonase YvrE
MADTNLGRLWAFDVAEPGVLADGPPFQPGRVICNLPGYQLLDSLAVEAGGSLMVVGAAVCVELWQPAAWNAYVTSEMPGFRQRIDDLTA